MKVNLSKFMAHATAEDVQKLKCFLQKQDAVTEVASVDEVMEAVADGKVDLESLRSTVNNREWQLQREEECSRREEEEATKEAEREAFRNSTVYRGLAAKIKGLQAEYNAMMGLDFSAKFNIPVTLTVQLDEKYHFEEFFNENFSGEVEDITNLFDLCGLKVVVDKDCVLTDEQRESVQFAFDELAANYDCEMVAVMFKDLRELIDGLYQKGKAIVIEYDELAGQHDIDVAEMLDE